MFGSHDPISTVDHVDLDRYLGDWYVQGHVPTLPEKDSYNAVESYALGDDGRVLTVFAFRRGGFDGPIRTLEPTGFVEDERTNAEWGMRFLWPFKAEYLIAHVDDDYTETIVARSKRDYVWIMTREPEIAHERYEALVGRVAALGYDVEKLRRVPQRWPDPEHPVSRAGGDLARSERGS